jgi:hypothetical protein
LITTEGKVYIKRYLAGWVPRMASSMAFGVGGKVEEADDKRLQFEIGRADIAITSYDFVNDKIVFKAPLPDEFEGIIYEIGLFSQEKNALSGDYASMLIADFDPDTEDWVDPVSGNTSTYNSTNTRIGSESLRLVATAGNTSRALLQGISYDFSGNTTADRFLLAYNVSSNVASIELRLKNDDANYFTISYSPAAGYRVNGLTIGTATITGSPDWSEINMIEVRVTATGGGTATVDFDGIRIEDTDTPNPEYVMVSRELLSTPFVKEAGRIQAIEFTLDVAV